jgi:ribonuclease P protein component
MRNGECGVRNQFTLLRIPHSAFPIPHSAFVQTLKTNGQFERVRRAGRSWAVGPVVLNAAPNGETVVRCGFVAGKKVGGAVERNRARRLIREAVRLRLPGLKPGWDLVWIARSSINEADFASVSKAVDEALKRGKLLASAGAETAVGQSRIIGMDVDKAASSNMTDQEPGNGSPARDRHEKAGAGDDTPLPKDPC